MVSIVSGLIIDTFGSLREKDAEKNSDIRDRCFICGNNKIDFDRVAESANGFNLHIKANHYMWAYIYYIAYLKDKDPNEYNGVESYIADKISKNNINWFPINNARELAHELDDDEII